jgi:hypothetical protein
MKVGTYSTQSLLLPKCTHTVHTRKSKAYSGDTWQPRNVPVRRISGLRKLGQPPFCRRFIRKMRVRADANKRIGALWYSAHGPSHCNFNCNNCVGKSRGSFVELGQQSDITHPVVRLDFFFLGAGPEDICGTQDLQLNRNFF